MESKSMTRTSRSSVLKPLSILQTATVLFTLLGTAISAPHEIRSSEIKWVDCSQNPPDVPDFLNIFMVDLTNLPSNLHCGQIDVPMDYSKPLSEDNKITVGFSMVRPAEPQGVIFYNGGGTDANSVVAWLVALNLTDAFAGLEDYDLMMMDIRGTFSSNPLNLTEAGFEAANTLLLGPLPTTQEEFDATRNASATFIQSWIDASTPPGIIRFLGTYDSIKDYEEIRKALGYDKINFLGSSYGTYRAQAYAAEYPEQVDRFVLDAVVPHGRSNFDKTQDAIAALNRALLRADAYCQNNLTCPTPFKNKGAIPNVLHQILANATQSPLPISECEIPTGCYPNATALDIQKGMYNYLSGSPDFPNIIAALMDASQGDGNYFPAGPKEFNVESFVGIPIECADSAFQDTAFAEWNLSYSTALENDATGIGQTIAWEIQLGCLGWPFKSYNDKSLNITHPMLLVTSDFDMNAPTEWTTFAWSQYPNSTLIVRHGDDHTSLSLTDQPATIMMREYLRTGILPLASNSTLATVYEPGMVRDPISDSYEVPTGALGGDVDSGSEGNVTVPAALP